MVNVLEIKDLTKSFGGLIAVKKLSLSVKEGEILGLIGPNGSGKTTVFNLVTGFYRPTAGKVYYRGEDITGKSPHLICKKGIVRTFQIVRTFLNLTVEDNVAVGGLVKGRGLDEAKRKAREVLEFTRLDHKRNILAKSLTLADRKRLEMARALACDPDVLLLDEVMAGLNPKEVDDALELIRAIQKQGISQVVVEHVMRAVMNVSERVVVLHHGEKIAEGLPSEVAKMEHVIEAYLGRGLRFASH